MKKFILALMVVTTLVSCGKDNKVASGNGTVITNPLVAGSTIAQQLVSKVDNPSTGFGNGFIANASNNQDCETKWKIFTYCTYSTGSNGGSSGQTWNQAIASDPGLIFQYLRNGIYRTVTNNNEVTVASQQQRIRELINAATEITSDYYGYVYNIRTASGIYVVDTRYAIQMNPAGSQEAGMYEYFLRAL